MIHHHRRSRLLGWLKRLLPGPAAAPSAIERARAVVAAVDAGGLPLNPLTINDIARGLGLEVSRRAPVEETVGRIRAALARHDSRIADTTPRR